MLRLCGVGTSVVCHVYSQLPVWSCGAEVGSWRGLVLGLLSSLHNGDNFRSSKMMFAGVDDCDYCIGNCLNHLVIVPTIAYAFKGFGQLLRRCSKDSPPVHKGKRPVRILMPAAATFGSHESLYCNSIQIMMINHLWKPLTSKYEFFNVYCWLL